MAALGLALLYMPKGELHLLLCDRHTHARDIFYRYYTQVAEWFPYIVCIALLLFSRIGEGVFASACMLGSALVTQICKHFVNAPRPVTWFATNMPDVSLPVTEGVRMNEWYSFPSGHTTSFFALAFVLCILATKSLSAQRSVSETVCQRKRSISVAVQLLLFSAAALGGYSRIYLSQHFAADVLAGIIVGVFVTMLCWTIFRRFEGKNWYNYRLFTKK